MGFFKQLPRKIKYLKIVSKLLLVLIAVIWAVSVVRYCDVWIVYFFGYNTYFVIACILGVVVLASEIFSFIAQKKAGVLLTKSILKFFGFCFLLFCCAFGAFLLLAPGAGYCSRFRSGDTRVVSAIVQSRTVMAYLNSTEGNYDNFRCDNKDMKPLCEEIDMFSSGEGDVSMFSIRKGIGNFRLDGREPIIAWDAPRYSQRACIYSPLNRKIEGRQAWYCADSLGYAGVTTTDPSTAGCSMAGGAKCPGGLVSP